MPSLKLIYLPVRARAEPIRMALAYANIPYLNETLAFKDLAKAKVCTSLI